MSDPMTIGALCTRDVVIAFRSMSLVEAAQLMREQHVGSLVVIDETPAGRTVAGMLTDRDIVVAVVARDADARNLRVGDLMTSDLVTAREDDSIYDVLAAMRRRGVRRVPVVTPGGVLVGIVTLDDLLEAAAEQLQGLVNAIQSERREEGRRRG